MDANKLKVLQDIGYVIQEVCGLCRHGRFNYSQLFGACTIRTYGHLKHSAPAKDLSVSRYGWCPEFEYDEQYDVLLHGFKQLLRSGP
jgi:hypothetical protein